MSSNHSSCVSPDSAVHAQLHDGIYQIVLNRPESRNALGKEMIEGLLQALDEAVNDARVRVVVFAATGKAFCAGGNLGNVSERLSEPASADGRDPIALGNRLYGRFLEQLLACPKPTVAVVQGAAMGGGAGLVCATDIAIAVRDAKFGFPETSIGLVPAQILPFVADRIGVQHARRMMLTGDRITAEDAFRIGLIDYLEEDAEALGARLDQVAAALKQGGPKALAHTKNMFRTVFGRRDWQDKGLSAYLDAASDVFAEQLRSEALEGIAAARERRSPVW
ncbi:enoyl-CoA hydratase/isomerase family protein [Alcaligenaceae bacterium]|nr:enoyl-CoA hydratase/isomerase family protein [Alcaligenaceae bacterium]